MEVIDAKIAITAIMSLALVLFEIPTREIQLRYPNQRPPWKGIWPWLIAPVLGVVAVVIGFVFPSLEILRMLGITAMIGGALAHFLLRE